MTGREVIPLRQGFEQLQIELSKLETEELPAAINAMQRAAADKDFRENAPYDAAKEHRAVLQRRIDEIKETLSHAAVVDDATDDRVGVGTRVVVRDMDEDEEFAYTLVGPGERGIGKISTQSPRKVEPVTTAEAPGSPGLARPRVTRVDSGRMPMLPIQFTAPRKPATKEVAGRR